MMRLCKHKDYAETVRDIVEDRASLTFQTGDKLPDILQRMHKHGGGAGGVIDARGKLVGLITEREIVLRAFGNYADIEERLDTIAGRASSQEITAWDVMIPVPNTLNVADTVEDALDIITYFGYRYMPVVDTNNHFRGVVDARELQQHALARSQDLLERKDGLLSYLMHEPYGIGAAI